MSDKQYIERYWRDATPADAIKEPPMVARFRDEPSDDWITDLLCGHDTRRGYWFSSSDDISQTTWWHCQVYDAPDPGEGWRLVDTEKEKPQEGDEVWVEGGKWEPVQESLYYGKRCAFRRRIEPPRPQWIRVTRDNVAEYLFRECQYRHSTTYDWRKGIVCGWDEQDCCCLVYSDDVEEIPIMNWKYVEVQA